MADVKSAATKTAAPSAGGDDPFPKSGRKLTTGGLVALLVKVVLLAIIDALTVFGVWVLIAAGDWIAAIALTLVVAGVNYVYLRPGLLPGKYLTPGLAFLAVFQIFVIIYTGYIAFTNAGDQHNSTKQDAIEQIIRTSQERVPDSPEYTVEVYKQADQFGLLVAEPGGGTAFGTSTRSSASRTRCSHSTSP